jgi:hypothetical protein
MSLLRRTHHWFRAACFIAVSMMLLSGLEAQENSVDRIVGEVRDPATGARWVLMRNAEHPAAPAHWVLAGAGADTAEQRLVIRSGDKIVVGEQTSVLTAWFEATALTSAENGGELRARLAIGGTVLAVRAIAPGAAEIEEETRR